MYSKQSLILEQCLKGKQLPTIKVTEQVNNLDKMVSLGYLS